MIEIKKGTEPKELLEYRQQKFASYADMPADVKKKVIKSLLLEQRRSIIVHHSRPQQRKSVWIIKIWSQSAGETAMHIPMMTKAVMQKEAL